MIARRVLLASFFGLIATVGLAQEPSVAVFDFDSEVPKFDPANYKMRLNGCDRVELGPISDGKLTLMPQLVLTLEVGSPASTRLGERLHLRLHVKNVGGGIAPLALERDSFDAETYPEISSDTAHYGRIGVAVSVNGKEKVVAFGNTSAPVKGWERHGHTILNLWPDHEVVVSLDGTLHCHKENCLGKTDKVTISAGWGQSFTQYSPWGKCGLQTFSAEDFSATSAPMELKVDVGEQPATGN